MINKITKKCLIEIIDKCARTAQSSFRKIFLSTGILFFLLPLFSSQIYSQTAQVLTIPSGSLIVNTGVSPIAYAYSDWAYLITDTARKTEQLGALPWSITTINHKYI